MLQRDTFFLLIVLLVYAMGTTATRATPIFHDNESFFSAAIGGSSLINQDLEFEKNQGRSVTLGGVTVSTGYDIDGVDWYATRGSRSLEVQYNSDRYVEFTFATQVQAFAIDILDAVDFGKGELLVALDGGPAQSIANAKLPDGNQLFLGITDSQGFSTVRIHSTVKHDAVYYDNLRYGQIVSVPEPATAALIASGLLSIFILRRRHRPGAL